MTLDIEEQDITGLRQRYAVDRTAKYGLQIPQNHSHNEF